MLLVPPIPLLVLTFETSLKGAVKDKQSYPATVDEPPLDTVFVLQNSPSYL